MKFTERMTLIQSLEPDVSGVLSPTNFEEAKVAFLADKSLVSPPFEYGKLSRHLEEELLVRPLLAAFEAAGYENNAQKEVLTWACSKLQLQCKLLGAINSYRERLALGRRSEADDWSAAIRQINEDLYGPLGEETFINLLIRQLAKASFHSSLECEMKLVDEMRSWFPSSKYQLMGREELEANLGKRRPGVTIILDKIDYGPTPELVQQFGELCRQKMAKSLARVPMDRDELAAEEVCELVNTVLREDFPYPVRFRAVVDEHLNSISVDYRSGLMSLPKRRGLGAYTPQVVRNIAIGHEVTHVKRAAFAEEYCQELAVPLPGYEEFEEGVAKAVEQALSGTYQEPNTDHYLIIGMASYKGLSFREVFDRQRALNLLIAVSPTDTEEEVRRKAAKVESVVFTRVTRCFRGTGVVPLTKDLVYFHGQMSAWDYIQRHIHEPEKLWRMLFESGKTDPTRPLHQKLMRTLGWTEEDF